MPPLLCLTPTPTPSSFQLHRELRTRCSGNFPFSSARTIALAILMKHENYYVSACFARGREREREALTGSNTIISFSFGSLSHFCPLLHHPLKQCQQQKAGDVTPPAPETNVTDPALGPSLKALRPQGSVRILFRRCLPSIPACTWMLHCSVQSACNPRFPHGLNWSISIISRSFITRSPYLHSPQESNIMKVTKQHFNLRNGNIILP